MLRQALQNSLRGFGLRWTGRSGSPRVTCFKVSERAHGVIRRKPIPISLDQPKSRSGSRIHNHLWRSDFASAEQPDQARGGLPRFHVDEIPRCEGMVAKVEGDEFWHMIKVLRLKVNDSVELFDGKGGIVDGRLVSINRRNAEVTAMEYPRILAPARPRWHVAAAFCTLKGGRGEWLVEKCTELGASSLTPLMTERSSVTSGGRPERWERIAMAATKQCQRLHSMEIRRPLSIEYLLPQITGVDFALVAAAEAPPLFKSLAQLPGIPETGILVIGPEGDFTVEEINALMQAGAKPVGLGPRRLRVETAAVALLAGVMLMSDVDDSAARRSAVGVQAHGES